MGQPNFKTKKIDRFLKQFIINTSYSYESGVVNELRKDLHKLTNVSLDNLQLLLELRDSHHQMELGEAQDDLEFLELRNED